MRIVLTFGLVAAVSAGAGAAAQHIRTFTPSAPMAPPLAAPLVPSVPRQVTAPVPARARTRMPVEKNPYGPTPSTDGRLGEIAGHESGLLEAGGESSYRRVAGPRPHIASNPYYFSDVDDGQDREADPTLGAMSLDENPYAH
jgi:hypothetical protein